MSLKTALEEYKHIELSEDEIDEAILAAKQKKDERMKEEERNLRIREKREKLFTHKNWDTRQTNDFMLGRAKSIFKDAFLIDPNNSLVFKMLCAYFSEDIEFISLCENLGIPNPSLYKGLMLQGNFGVGKTWLMKLFSKNKRQVFRLANAKSIANAYEEEGQAFGEMFVENTVNAINDAESFYQRHSGLCIDDIGTEDVKTHFGNKKNVIGDLIEIRYARGNTGLFLHGTTNLTAEQLTNFYGGRVASRMREVFNFIELPGKDRRL